MKEHVAWTGRVVVHRTGKAGEQLADVHSWGGWLIRLGWWGGKCWHHLQRLMMCNLSNVVVFWSVIIFGYLSFTTVRWQKIGFNNC